MPDSKPANQTVSGIKKGSAIVFSVIGYYFTFILVKAAIKSLYEKTSDHEKFVLFFAGSMVIALLVFALIAVIVCVTIAIRLSGTWAKLNQSILKIAVVLSLISLGVAAYNLSALSF